MAEASDLRKVGSPRLSGELSAKAPNTAINMYMYMYMYMYM